MSREFEELKSRVDELTTAVSVILSAVSDDTSGRPVGPVTDVPVYCEHCKRAKLGIYSPVTGVLRIKNKDQLVTVRKGDTDILCRSCAGTTSFEYSDDSGLLV